MKSWGIDDYILQVSGLMNLPVSEVTGKSRKRKLVDCRRIITMIGKDQGFGVELIGKTLNMDRTSVYYLLASGKHLAETYSEFNDKYQLIKALIHENQTD